jgi:Cof subfamily protein (haloacid dehalogenase superfamily)
MRALALDLDETLLNSNKSVGTDTVRALFKWLDSGEKIYLVTSRPIRSVRKFIPSDLLNRVTTISLNGAVVCHPNGERIKMMTLGDNAREIVERFENQDHLHLTVEFAGEEFASNVMLSERQLWDIHAAHPGMLIPINNICYEEVVKIAIDGMGRKLTNELTWLRSNENLNPIPALNGTFINLLPRQMDKADTLAKQATEHGIPLSGIIAFGDDEPDLGMMKIAGLSVAMKNAIPAVKQVADIIIGHHDDDVIGHFIEHELNQATKITS